MENKDFRKAKRSIKDSTEMFDKIKGLIGASDIMTPKTPLDFKSEEEFENYCKEYIEKYNIDITDFANKIFILNERVNATKENAIELYQMLISGFCSFLLLKNIKEKLKESKK